MGTVIGSERDSRDGDPTGEAKEAFNSAYEIMPEGCTFIGSIDAAIRIDDSSHFSLTVELPLTDCAVCPREASVLLGVVVVDDVWSSFTLLLRSSSRP